LVATDQVVNIHRLTFRGHVYDLSTVARWYLADGLIVHNSARDERVRPTHVDTHGQEIPGNLRFMLPKLNHQPGHDPARHPRDPDLPIGQAVNCRCETVETPDGLSRTIHRGPVTIEGTRVTGEVGTRFPRAAESEHGTSGDQPAYFMRRAIMEVAARTPGTQQR
jgi:hypothetical protein